MAYHITNQSTGTVFSTDDNETVLEAALKNNIMMPYGCRSGACGACKCQLISGEIDYGNYESYALNEQEIAAGQILACQATAHSDLTIDAKEVKMDTQISIKTLPARIKAMNQLSDDVMQLFLQLPKTQSFPFISGQYIDILLKNGQRRSFSIANRPHEITEDGIELHIRRVDDGYFTPKVFNAMRNKDLVRFEGPFGSYILQTEAKKPLLMIAGGTGFAPIKALINEAYSQDTNWHVTLYWGVRDQADLYDRATIEDWQNRYPNFRFIPVLSETTSSDWSGETGYVHESIARNEDSFKSYDIYASGPPPMVDAVEAMLKTRDADLDRLFVDAFEFAPR